MISRERHAQTLNGKRTPTYASWHGMRQRCLNPRNTGYKWYGALGVAICDRWDSFTNFLEDMGERPLGKTLDRIDTNGNYEPSNCKWSTLSKQQRNKRPWTDKLKSSCPNGHPYTEASVYVYQKPNGSTTRKCRLCNNARVRELRMRMVAQ